MSEDSIYEEWDYEAAGLMIKVLITKAYSDQNITEEVKNKLGPDAMFAVKTLGGFDSLQLLDAKSLYSLLPHFLRCIHLSRMRRINSYTEYGEAC